MKKLFSALLLAAVAVVGHTQTAEKPVIRVGDTAVYVFDNLGDRVKSEDTLTTVQIDGDVVKGKYVRAERNPPETEFLLTSELNTILSGSSGTRFETHGGTFKFPMAVGNTWSNETTSLSANGSKSKWEGTSKVVAYEKIKVPAGEFDAFKVETTGWIKGISWNGSIRAVQTVWYAPATNRWVRMEYKDYRGSQLWNNQVIELKSFKSGG